MRLLLAACLLWYAGEAFADQIDKDGATHWLDGVQIEQKEETSPAPKHDVWYALGSWQAMMFCQIADIVSTEWAFRHNHRAYEENSLPRPVLYPIKVAIPLVLREVGWNDFDQVGVRVGVNALACSPVINNIQVGRSR